MNTRESADSLGTSYADPPDVPIEQSEPDRYLPGTPTVSFLESVEIAVRALVR